MHTTTPEPTSDAVTILNRMFGDGPERRARLERIKQQMEIGSDIYAARTSAGLTQAQLAEKVGTTEQVICDLEDAEFEGDPMAVLRRMAEVLNATVQVRLTPKEPTQDLVAT